MATGEPFRLANAKCWRSYLNDTSDQLGFLDTNTAAYTNGTFGGSVPVAWHRQNALYDLSMGGEEGGGDDENPSDSASYKLHRSQTKMHRGIGFKRVWAKWT